MAWYDPNPSQDQLDFWQGHPASNVHKVSKWPHPNTLRINPRYRVKDTDPTLIPLAFRYGLYYSKALIAYDPDVPEFNAAGSWDLLVRGDNHIGVTTEENSEGYTLDINVQHRELLPVRNVPGVEFNVEFQHATLGNLNYFEEYPVGELTKLWKYNMNTFVFSDVGNRYWTQPDPPYAELLIPRLFGVSDCYLFPMLPVGFASFNGSDAYISLNNTVAFTANPFRVSCEVRLNQTINHWPVLGKDMTGGFMGMKDDDIIFGNLTLPTTWTPVTDVWLTWVYEFEPVSQLQHKLTIAGVVVRDSTNARQFPPFNNLGVYKRGVSGTLWADMDMRNLKIETGTPGNYTTLLDMPLFENALDVGPQANHGTTFNMALPSV